MQHDIYNNIQHDTTTYNKVVKRYKLFLHNKCCTLLYKKLGSVDKRLILQGSQIGINGNGMDKKNSSAEQFQCQVQGLSC